MLFTPCVDFQGPLPALGVPSIFFAVPSTLSCLIKIVRAVEAEGIVVSCYVPGPTTVALTMLNQLGVRIFDTRPALRDVLPNASVVLTASADLALSAYLAGRPQLIIKTDRETSVVASELETRQTAIALDPAELGSLGVSLRELLYNSSFAHSAYEEARRALADARADESVANVAHQCMELLTSNGCAP
jgi:hypothetical protein